jgi:branched-chain amino acid transport system ATP-binding protein
MLLRLEAVTVQFGGLKAVSDLTMEVEQGKIFALIGPNGAGKTTVLNCISRFYTPQSGRIEMDGHDLLKKKPHQVVELGVARSFQNVELFANMSVIDNLLTGLHHALKNNVLTSAFALPTVRREEKQALQKAEEMLQLLGIEGIRNELVKNLPFGMQKMVDIGRALMTQPKLLMLDEPVAGMNSVETRQLGDLIVRLRDELGVTVLMIEHDMSLVMKISDRIAVLDFGEKIAEGTAEEVQNNPAVIEAYLGEAADLA